MAHTPLACSGVAAAGPPSSPLAGPSPTAHPTVSAPRTSATAVEARAQAWTAGFHRLTGDYLAGLSRLVNETMRAVIPCRHRAHKAGGDSSEGGVGGPSSLPETPVRLRRQGLGGDAQEDAALELDATDLRRAERDLLLELQVRQTTRRAEKPMQHPSAPGTAMISPASRRTSLSSVPAASRRTSLVAVQNSPTKRSPHAEQAAAAAPREEEEEEEPAIPPNVLDLFRHAHHLTASTSAPTSPLSVSPTVSNGGATASAGRGVKGGEELEAEAMARLCMKYFLTPSPLKPALVAPPPLPPVDQPWSPSDASRQPRRAAGAGAAPGPHAQVPALRHPLGRAGEQAKSFRSMDVTSFPPPNLHPHQQQRPHQQQQKQHQSSQHSSSMIGHSLQATPSRPSFSPGSTKEGAHGSGLPTSLSSPAAWRKLIEKRTAAASGGDHTPLPNIIAARANAAATATPTTTTATRTPATAGRQLNCAEQQQLPARDDDFSFGFPPPRALFTSANTAKLLEVLVKEDTKDGSPRRYLLAGRLLLNKNHRVQDSKAADKSSETTPRLPELTQRPAPSPPRQAPSSVDMCSPHPKHAATAAPRRHPRVTHTTAPSNVSSGCGAAPRTSPRRTKRSVHGPFAPIVVLPPHYHGLHGEMLTTAELELLLKSVAQEEEEAQATLDNTYEAADTAAEALFAVQQSVAQVLLENVQLERDIKTLTCTSALAAPRGGVEGNAAAAAAPAAPAAVSTVMPPSRRGLLAIPAPAPATAAAAAPLLNSLFTSATKGPQRGGKGRAKRDKAATQSTAGMTSPSLPQQHTAAATAAADRYYDPALVLEELQAATAAREAEHAQTLSEIDDLSRRIARHDALLQAVAEYWRRNAAVMKRQQFAVQEKPLPVSTNIGTGQSGGREGGPDIFLSERNDVAGSPTSSNASSTVRMPGRSCSSATATSVDPTESSATPYSRVPELSGSPSQLDRVLAHMEAVSPTQPSSAVSFDLHLSQSRTIDNSSAPPMVQHQQRRETVRRRTDMGGGGGAAAVAEAPWLSASKPLPQQQCQQQKDAALLESSFHSYAKSSPTTIVETTGTTRTLFSSPEPPSEDGDEQAGVSISARAPPRTGRKDTVAADTPSLTVMDEWAAQEGVTRAAAAPVGHHAAPPPRPPLMIESAVRRGGETGTASELASLFNATFARRGEDEEVLEVGSWRTIPAMQLEKVDEIAEFIYSVFERA